MPGVRYVGAGATVMRRISSFVVVVEVTWSGRDLHGDTYIVQNSLLVEMLSRRIPIRHWPRGGMCSAFFNAGCR